MAHPSLSRSPLLVGLDESELDAFEALGRQRRFETGEELCRAGDPTDTIMLITSGLVHWFAPTIQGAGQLLLRLRKGDPIGAQDAIAGELRSATAVASIVTSALELDADEFREFAQRHPQILVNIVRNQRERMFRVNERSVENERGEEIALVAGDSVRSTIGRVVAAARLASPRPVTYLDRQLSFAGSITAADDLTAKHGTVFIPSELDPQLLAMMLDEVDRVVALVGTAEEARKLGELSASQRGHRIEVVLIGDEAAAASRAWGPDSGVTIVRTCEWHEKFPLGDVDLLWLARHLTRTKLGIALGAGGAKGFAHVGMLQVLEENGYTIDFAGGSSIGGFVAAHVALGYDAQETYSRFRAAFAPDTVAELFAPMRGATTGLAALTQMLQEATELQAFSDAVIPLVIMAVDLTDRAAAPLRDGPLWEALLAALAVAGVYPAARARAGTASWTGSRSCRCPPRRSSTTGRTSWSRST